MATKPVGMVHTSHPRRTSASPSAKPATFWDSFSDLLAELQRFAVSVSASSQTPESLSKQTRARINELLLALSESPERLRELPAPMRNAILRFLVTNVHSSLQRGTHVFIATGSDGAGKIGIGPSQEGTHSTGERVRISLNTAYSHEAVSAGAIEFMGGKRVFKTLPQSRADIHGTIVRGLPYAVLVNIVNGVKALTANEVANAIGISTRTLRRQKEDPKRTMPPELASKTWMFAETLAKASEVFGGREAAERWMSKPAMGLDGARPIDLLRTLQGAELVNEFLGRLEHGVYN